MVDYQVRLKGDDDKEYLISYEALRNKLGVDAVRDYLAGRISSLTQKFNELERHYITTIVQPKMEAKILSLLKDNPDLKTREISTKAPNNRFEMLAWHDAFDKLEREREILSTSHGKGHNRTWRVNEGG